MAAIMTGESDLPMAGCSRVARISYSYAYMPDAVIFVKSLKYQNRAYWSVKVLIDDEFYEMRPIPAK